MKIEIKILKTYLKDILIAGFFILISFILYQKPVVKLKEYQPLTNIQSKNEGTEQTQELFPELSENIFIFKQVTLKEKEQVQPSFKQVLFNEKYGNIKLIAITGDQKNKRALLLDHMNNLRVLKKGDKIEDVLVSSITDTSVKFKFQNETRELSLYKKRDLKASVNVSPTIPQPEQIRRHVPPPSEEIIEDDITESNEQLRKIKPRKGLIK